MTDFAKVVAVKFAAGLAEIEPLLAESGFVRESESSGKGSGGNFVTCVFAKDERKIELWLRGNSLSVSYKLAERKLDHAGFMREVLGPGGPNRFPAFADDAAVAFKSLRYDLQHFCADFLDGNGDEFRRCSNHAEDLKRLSGFQRLAQTDEQLRQRLGREELDN